MIAVAQAANTGGLWPWPDWTWELTPEQRAEILQFFPEQRSPYRAVGRWVVVQERLPRTSKTLAGGKTLYFAGESVDKDRMVMNIGRVVSIGPATNIDPVHGDVLPENAQLHEGMFVRIPKFSSDRPTEGDKQVVFKLLRYEEISAEITDMKALLR